MLYAGGDTFSEDTDGWTLLMHAADCPNEYLVWFLDYVRKEHPQDFDQFVHYRANGEYIALIHCMYGSLENFKVLLPLNNVGNQLSELYGCARNGYLNYIECYNMGKIPDFALLQAMEGAILCIDSAERSEQGHKVIC